MRIGLLTDTHTPGAIRTLYDEVRTVFQGVDLILHGGDITSPSVLDWLGTIAPVIAAQGNNDMGWKDPRMSPVHVLDLEGWRLGLIHDLEPEDRPITELRGYFPSPVDIMVCGHTHFERLDYRDSVLLLNSGSAIHPHQFSARLGTVGILELSPGKIDARIVQIGVTPEMRNPGVEYFFKLGH